MNFFHWKKFSICLLTGALLVGFTACGNSSEGESSTPTDVIPTESQAPAETPTPTETVASPETTPVVTAPTESSVPKETKPPTESKSPDASASAAENTESGDYSGVTAIGDSVMLGAKDEMEKHMKGIVVEASESRQIWSGKDVAQELEAKGKLGNIIVLALGTNGTFKKSTARELLDYFGENRTIYWVTAYGSKLSWQDQVNTTIEEVSAEYDNVHVLHWDEVGPDHADWFYKDGLHLNGAGRKGYAEFLKENIEL